MDDEQFAYDNPFLCPDCTLRFPDDEARSEHYKTCEIRLRRIQERRDEMNRIKEYHRNQKTLSKIEDRLEELYLGKECRLRHQTDRPFKKVVGFRITGPPSAWTWAAWLEFEDGEESPSFKKVRDVEILRD